MNPDRLRATLQRHEGKIVDTRGRHVPYADTQGVLTIGYGRNLEAMGLTEAEALALLDADIQVAVDGCRVAVPRWDHLGPVRQEALVNMCFNLGLSRFRRFQKMLRAIAAGDWDRTAAEALDSKWASQVGRRADEIAYMIRTGEALMEAA